VYASARHAHHAQVTAIESALHEAPAGQINSRENTPGECALFKIALRQRLGGEVDA